MEKQQTPKTQQSYSPQKAHAAARPTSTPTDPILRLQKNVGNHAVGRLLRSGAIQAKLIIGQPDDPYEREADRVAEAVVRTPVAPRADLAPVLPGGTPPAIQRSLIGPLEDEMPPEDDSEGEVVQRKAAAGGTAPGPVGGQRVHSYLDRSRGRGQPLAPAVRAFMEPRLGHRSLNGVRVHADGPAAEAARALHARAFTRGQDIYFGAGQYQPHTASGRRLLAHELVHTFQQGGAIRRQTEAQRTAMEQAIETARTSFPALQRDLQEATLRIYVLNDRIVAHVSGQSEPLVYPAQIMRAQSGYYLIKWGADNLPTGMWNLQNGQQITRNEDVPFVAITAGMQEWQATRTQRVGVVWISRTVTEPPEPEAPTAAGLQFPLSPAYEIAQQEFERLRESLPPRPLVIPGVTGGVFQPDYEGSEEGRPGYYGRPFNFTYYTHDGMFVLVSRRMVERDFYYVVPTRSLQDFMRFYPIEYAGLAARGMATLAQIVVDISISFIPIVGPLWGLAMAARSAYHAYHNWDRMSGWEKGLVGLEVMLSLVPAVRTGARIARGAAAYNRGVNSLVTAGLTQAEARRLMLAAAVFQSERSALTVVDNLGDLLRRGERLTAQQLAQVEHVFELMLQRLPTAERLAISASFATRNVDTARQFLHGLELSERHLAGLRRLVPEALVAFRQIARSHPEFVQRVAMWAEQSAEVAQGINKLHGVARPGHLVYIIGGAGEDVLQALGRTPVAISDDLATFVRGARNSADAYRRLMQGTTQGGRNIVGLAQLLSHARPTALTPALQAIESQFSRVFLTTTQLGGLARLNTGVRDALTRASESQLRRVATIAARSDEAARGVNEVAEKLLAQGLNGYAVGNVIYHVGGGIIEQVGRLGITVSDDLARAVARRRGSAELLVMGRGGRYPVTGLLDEIAGRMGGVLQVEEALQGIASTRFQAELFSRWATRNPQLIDGIEAIRAVRPADAQAKIAGIFRAVGGDFQVARDFFSALGVIHRQSGAAVQLERMVGELAAGGTKTMGASLTLTYAVRRLGGQVAGFELAVARNGIQRVYDLVARGTHYEFKYWTTFGGEPARAAASEFARDVILHAGTDFRNLRWVISRAAAGHLPAIQSMMRGVLTRPQVRQALEAQGLVVDDVLATLRRELDRGLIEFF